MTRHDWLVVALWVGLKLLTVLAIVLLSPLLLLWGLLGGSAPQYRSRTHLRIRL